MNLQLVNQTPHGFKVLCKCCGRYCGVGSTMPDPRIWADLLGEPWKAYYCPECVDLINSREYD